MMMLETLLPVLLTPFGPAPSQEPTVQLPEGGAQVELLDHGGRPVVELRIDEHVLRVLLDTGSTVPLILSGEAFERLGIAPPAEEAHGSSSLVLPEARLGDALLEHLPVGESPFLVGLPGVDGVLGFPSFEGCLLTLDFPGKLVRLDEGTLEEGPDTVPFRADEVMGFGMVVDVDVAGSTIPAHVDTGSPDLALFSNVAREGMALKEAPRLLGRARTPMGDADITEARLDGALRLGPIVFEEPAMRFASLPQIAGRRLGNVGSAFFRGTRITIDQRQKRMRIELGGGAQVAARVAGGPRRAEPEPSRERRRLGVQLAGQQAPDGTTRFAVASVVAGSEAERAGLRAGDQLVELDGGAVTQPRLGRALEGAAPIRLTVERGGERVVLVLFAGAGDDGSDG